LARCSVVRGCVAPRDPRSFPARRSSDLGDPEGDAAAQTQPDRPRGPGDSPRLRPPTSTGYAGAGGADGAVLHAFPPGSPDGPHRSEEHTSELQSRENLVCRPLLETKNIR